MELMMSTSGGKVVPLFRVHVMVVVSGALGRMKTERAITVLDRGPSVKMCLVLLGTTAREAGGGHYSRGMETRRRLFKGLEIRRALF